MTNKKRLRVGSDEYTIDLERRVNSVEAQMKDFLDLLREKDNRITELEAQLKEKSCSCETKPNVSESADTVPAITEDAEESPVEDHDCLVLTDSLGNSLDPTIINPEGGTTVVCVRGGTPKDIAKVFCDDISKKKRFKRVLVHFGTNLIPKFSPQYTADNIIENLLLIKRKAGPKCDVIFSGILPKLSDYFLDGIRFVNDQVISAGMIGPESVCWRYVDNMPMFFKGNSVDARCFKKDGIHLTKRGSNIFNRSIRRIFAASLG